MVQKENSLEKDIEETRAVMTEKIDKIEDRVNETMEGTKETISSVMDKVKGVQETIDAAKSTIDNILETVKPKRRHLVQYFSLIGNGSRQNDVERGKAISRHD